MTPPTLPIRWVRQNGAVAPSTTMKMFRDLSDEEIVEFKAWARANYTPLTPISRIWHPVVQAECAEMDRERVANVTIAAPELLEALENAVKWLRAIRSEANEALVIETAPDGASLCEMEGLILKAKGQP